VPSGHNAVGVSDPQGKGRLSAKQPSGFAFGEMARFESKIRSAPPFQPKRAKATAVAAATIEVAGRALGPRSSSTQKALMFHVKHQRFSNDMP